MPSQDANATPERFWTPEAGARLKAAIQAKGLTQDAAAKEAGIGRASLNAILQGRATPRPANLRKICEAVGVDPVQIWGLDQKFSASADVTEIDVLDGDMAAGAGLASIGDGSSDVSFAFPTQWLMTEFGTASQLLITRARGDSMEPTIRDGGLLILNTSDDDPTDAIYALRYYDHFYVKRVQRMGLLVRLLSDNGNYPPVDIDLRDEDARAALKIIGRVVWAGGAI